MTIIPVIARFFASLAAKHLLAEDLIHIAETRFVECTALTEIIWRHTARTSSERFSGLRRAILDLSINSLPMCSSPRNMKLTI